MLQPPVVRIIRTAGGFFLGTLDNFFGCFLFNTEFYLFLFRLLLNFIPFHGKVQA